MNTTAKKGHARVDVADALRGFSVLAIVLLHAIEHFNFYHFPDAASRGWLAAVDTGVWQSLFFLFSGKAYAIFALLFGFSFFIQHDNQRMRGHDFRLRFCRRLLVLFVIGNINACFFTGEILVTYALVGFVLVLTCRLSDRTLIALGALCLLQPVCLYYTARLLADPSFVPPAVDEGPLWAATFAAQSGGSFLETVRVNLWEGQLASLAYAWNHGRIFQTAGLFIIGMLTGRRGWFLRPALPYWGRALAIAIFCYFPLDSMHASAMELPNAALSFQLGMLLKSLANMCLMVMWVAGIMFAFYCSVRPARVLSALIPYGKLSMTNYVTQGIAGAAIFYHWGLGLQAGIGPAQTLPHGVVDLPCQLFLAAVRLPLGVPLGVPGAGGVEYGGEIQADEDKADHHHSLPEELRDQQHPRQQYRVDDQVGQVVDRRHQGGGQQPLPRAGQQAAALLVPLDFGANPAEEVVADALHHGGHHHGGQKGQKVLPRQGGEEEHQQHKGEAVGQHQRQGHHAPVAEPPPGDGIVPRLRRPPQEGVDQQIQAQVVKCVHGIGHSLSCWGIKGEKSRKAVYHI